jgi:hypothetical protein
VISMTLLDVWLLTLAVNAQFGNRQDGMPQQLKQDDMPPDYTRWNTNLQMSPTFVEALAGSDVTPTPTYSIPGWPPALSVAAGCGLQGRGLFASPIGAANAAYVAQTMRVFMRDDCFDFLLFPYDDGDWSAWDNITQVRLVYNHHRDKWHRVSYMFAILYLHAEAVSGYSHVFWWNDDVVPAQDFSARAYLQLAQTLRLPISQPAVGKNCHYCPQLSPSQTGCAVRKTSRVEVMAPVYSAGAWLGCVRPLLLLDYQRSVEREDNAQGSAAGWGADSGGVHSLCSCGNQFVVDVGAVGHEDARTGSAITAGDVVPVYEALHRARRLVAQVLGESNASSGGGGNAVACATCPELLCPSLCEVKQTPVATPPAEAAPPTPELWCTRAGEEDGRCVLQTAPGTGQRAAAAAP